MGRTYKRKKAAKTLCLAASTYMGMDYLKRNLVTNSQHDNAILSVHIFCNFG